jgi:hypothetical protein
VFLTYRKVAVDEHQERVGLFWVCLVLPRHVSFLTTRLDYRSTHGLLTITLKRIGLYRQQNLNNQSYYERRDAPANQKSVSTNQITVQFRISCINRLACEALHYRLNVYIACCIDFAFCHLYAFTSGLAQ